MRFAVSEFRAETVAGEQRQRPRGPRGRLRSGRAPRRAPCAPSPSSLCHPWGCPPRGPPPMDARRGPPRPFRRGRKQELHEPQERGPGGAPQDRGEGAGGGDATRGRQRQRHPARCGRPLRSAGAGGGRHRAARTARWGSPREFTAVHAGRQGRVTGGAGGGSSRLGTAAWRPSIDGHRLRGARSSPRFCGDYVSKHVKKTLITGRTHVENSPQLQPRVETRPLARPEAI